jgi:DNA-binding response OmpR family regulator
VLVVEDEDNIALALEYVVSREGYDYDRLSSGKAAVDHIQRTRPDLILLDVMLPYATGYEICKLVRGDPAIAATPILMMTAQGSAKERTKVMANGADGYIQKPFELKKIREAMASIFGRQE